MRKLIVSMNVTLDGYMAGSNCELDWHFKCWTSEMADTLCEELGKADTILLGRVTFSAMARYWPSRMLDCQHPREDILFAEMMNRYRKIVFSRTLATAEWCNAKLLKGDMLREVALLKKQPGKNIMIYGSGSVVAALMQARLIDEYQMWVHPVALGCGKPLLQNADSIQLRLGRTKTFSSGVVLCYYRATNLSSAWEWMRKPA
jgi:dihydrofolate reductase